MARPVGRRVRISDIWVDSPDSRDGGRDLWAIPKDLAEFTHAVEGERVQRTSWNARLDGREVVTARFTDVSGVAPRTPFRGATTQLRESGEEVRAAMTGSARSLPCRAHWTFHPEGPLGWLAGKRPLASFRMTDFAMSFG